MCPWAWRCSGAALAGALFLRWMEKRSPERQEAVIGIAFAVAACVAILHMSKDPHGAEHLKELPVGQILWSTWEGLVPPALVSLAVLAGWYGLRLQTSPLGFYLLFALTVTASVQVVGVYLLFASRDRAGAGHSWDRRSHGQAARS